MKQEIVTPYKSEATKKEQVAEMFDNIAHKYDFLNHFLSFSIDKIWRKKLINKLRKYNPKQVLDVATGTADLAIASLKLNPEKVTGIDISAKMLEVGKQKIKRLSPAIPVDLQMGDSENLQFEDKSFDAITCAFGVRNFENLEKGLKEMHRVLTDNGIVAILEFTIPRKFPVKQLYRFYFKYILPLWGKLISKDNAAYTYLPDSVEAFPQYEKMTTILNNCGFNSVNYHPQTFGIATIYVAMKG